MESIFQLLSNLVLFLTLATLSFAFGAYGALVLRRRKPRTTRRERPDDAQAVLLRRYTPRELE